MFCSQKCLGYAETYYHQYECVVIDSLREVLSENFMLAIRSFYIAYTICGSMEELIKFMCTDQKFCSVFDFDFNCSSIDKNYIKMIYSLPRANLRTSYAVTGILDKLFSHHPEMKNIWKFERNRNFINTFVDGILSASKKHGYYSCWRSLQAQCDPINSAFGNVFACNSNEIQGIHQHHSGIALLPFTSLIEMSCTPNCVLILVDSNFVVITVRPIKANEKLTIRRW